MTQGQMFVGVWIGYMAAVYAVHVIHGFLGLGMKDI